MLQNLNEKEGKFNSAWNDFPTYKTFQFAFSFIRQTSAVNFQ